MRAKRNSDVAVMSMHECSTIVKLPQVWSELTLTQPPIPLQCRHAVIFTHLPFPAA